MSRIDDLVARYCPQGVRYEAVGEKVLVRPTPRGILRTRYGDGSLIPIVDQGQSLVAGYTDDGALAIPAGQYVVFGDHTRAVKWVDFEFAVGADGTKVLETTEDLLPRFAYHAIANLLIPTRGYNRHWTILRDLRIPVPPVEVQRGVVEILDAFAELEAELETELGVRREQYAHYRETFFDFAESEGVRRATMGDVGTFIRGRRFTKKDIANDGIPCVHYGEIYTRYGVVAKSAFTQIRGDLRDRLRFALPGDVVIAGVGETVADVGKSLAWLGASEVAIHDDCFIFRSPLDPTYVAYYMQTKRFNDAKESIVSRAKVKRLSIDGLARMPIPVPPLAEQQRIVAILNAFEALVGDIRVGLPAELAARRKQYEHYRDRLLTFPEAS